MEIGTLLTLWSARVALLLFATALAAWWTGKSAAARMAWTLGLLVYVAHVAAAFHFRHHWSHRAAYEETALQTAVLFGIRSGSGLYCNYVFTVVWTCDVIWMWWRAETYHCRSRWIGIAIHSFMAFLFFNAAIVFVSGWARGLGMTVALALGILWFLTRR
jgi:hypothetical protein